MTAHPIDTLKGEARGVPAWRESLVQRWLSPGRRAVLWSFLDQMIVSGFGFVTGIATGRLVGLAEFGKFAIVMVFMTFAYAIHNAIFATPLMTLAGHRTRSRDYFGVVVILGALAAVALGVVGAVLFDGYYVLRGEAVSPLLVVGTGLLIAIQCILLILRRTFFLHGRGRFAVAMDLGRYALFIAVVAVLLAAEGQGVDAGQIVLALGGSGAVAAGAFLPAVGIAAAVPRARMVLVAAGQHWHIARWFVAVVLVAFAQEQLLMILAGFTLGDAAIGGMRAAQYLFGPILVLMSAMENILPVRAAAAYGSAGIAGLNRFLMRFGTVLIALNCSFILVAVLPGETWLRLLFGPAYADYVVVLPWLGAATACSLIRDMLVQYFRALRASNVIFRSFLAGFALAVVLIYPLVHWFGVVGLAMDTLASQFASMVYVAVSVARHRESAETLGRRQGLGASPAPAR